MSNHFFDDTEMCICEAADSRSVHIHTVFVFTRVRIQYRLTERSGVLKIWNYFWNRRRIILINIGGIFVERRSWVVSGAVLVASKRVNAFQLNKFYSVIYDIEKNRCSDLLVFLNKFKEIEIYEIERSRNQSIFTNTERVAIRIGEYGRPNTSQRQHIGQ